MKIIDITPEYQNLYFKCLEDWSDEMKESGPRKACWYGKYKDKGLRVKLALDDNEKVGGMIQYLPVEESFVEGENLYVILCIWVHGYKKGRGNFQKKGMGKALLQAAEEDVRRIGAKGLAAWGLWLPFWMKASWFKARGYEKVDRDSIRVLLLKRFADDAKAPRWIRRKKTPEAIAGKVALTQFINGWCPAQNIVCERAKRASAEFGENVLFQENDTSERDVFLEWGISDALFIGGKEVSTGPPPAYKKIRRLIAKEVRRL